MFISEVFVVRFEEQHVDFFGEHSVFGVLGVLNLADGCVVEIGPDDALVLPEYAAQHSVDAAVLFAQILRPLDGVLDFLVVVQLVHPLEEHLDVALHLLGLLVDGRRNLPVLAPPEMLQALQK